MFTFPLSATLFELYQPVNQRNSTWLAQFATTDAAVGRYYHPHWLASKELEVDPKSSSKELDQLVNQGRLLTNQH